MKFKSLIFIVLAASMTCTDIYAENNRPIDIALWENGPLEKNDDEGKTYDENVRIYRPSIKVFLPEGKNTGRAVIMCADTWLLLSRPTIRQNYGQLSKFSFIR